MNLRDVLRSRMSHEQVGLLLRLADWVSSHPGEKLTEAEILNLSGVYYPQSILRAMVHDALYAVGGPDRLDFSEAIEIHWPQAQDLLKYPPRGKVPTGKSSSKARETPAPSELTPEQWTELWNKIWRNRPWLIFPGQSEIIRHCTPRWVKQQTSQCLDWFRSRGKKHIDWVATVYVWLSRNDDQLLERAGGDVLSPASFHRAAEERPDRWPEVLKSGQ